MCLTLCLAILLLAGLLPAECDLGDEITDPKRRGKKAESSSLTNGLILGCAVDSTVAPTSWDTPLI